MPKINCFSTTAICGHVNFLEHNENTAEYECDAQDQQETHAKDKNCIPWTLIHCVM